MKYFVFAFVHLILVLEWNTLSTLLIYELITSFFLYVCTLFIFLFFIILVLFRFMFSLYNFCLPAQVLSSVKQGYLVSLYTSYTLVVVDLAAFQTFFLLWWVIKTKITHRETISKKLITKHIFLQSKSSYFSHSKVQLSTHDKRNAPVAH